MASSTCTREEAPPPAQEWSAEPLFEQTEVYTTTYSNNGDEADIYYPVVGDEGDGPFPVALLLQGGRVDKQYYSGFSAALASYGFVVVVPNHYSSFMFPEYEGEGLFSEVTQLQDTVEFMAAENQREGSPVAGLVDASTLVALGHSYGSAAIISAIQDRCDYPFCQDQDSYTRPPELAAVALSGIAMRPVYDPDHVGVQATHNLGMPFAMVNGSLEGNAILYDAMAGYELVEDGPKALIVVEGANHYGMCDVNNAPGPLAPDPNDPTISQAESIEAMARWSAAFLRAHALGEQGAWDYVHAGGHEDDPLVTVYADPPGEPLDIGPHIGLEWLDIQGGSFEQGNPEATAEMVDETPVHTVEVKDFSMLATEVTVDQYRACVEAGWCSAPSEGEGSNFYIEGHDEHPVNFVSWPQAIDFCDWVRGRLPTESEWEYAARNGGADMWPWGEGGVDCDHAVMEDASGVGCGTGTTAPVCSRPLGNTAAGACDMIGNVWEWTLDWYHDSYAGAPSEGSAWIDPRTESRVLRGGALSYDEYWNRTTARDSHGNPGFAVYTVGFRCVRGDWVDGDYQAPIVDPMGGGESNMCDVEACDFGCQSMACENPDGNTHDSCTCDADYCVPDAAGVEFAGLTPLTCTTRNCDPASPGTCPEGTECKVIPDFVIELMADNGIDMPATLCGAP